ncbi:OmpA-OmpF porin, OOP family [Pseudidiomarina planktonica]|uniref:OmpA-OmpF porin, OOP family n=1 Tax=Pseudidiomarina planktonica TaxID=1323738 RepID=A0A1Y6G467_9GAMM|nr:OmpA family protein [Pseudidiomarina planktonica]RUO62923.1 OmpA family protein [Pseudidiomarina planktonica]SMQ80815.1 OmpA-OmpF porin, OOP family [Pseudidiomarina planktonica]
MKGFTKIATAVAAALSAVMVLPAAAQDAQDRQEAHGDFYIGANSGFGWLDTDRVAIMDGQVREYEGGTDVFLMGLEAGYRIFDNWELRVSYTDLAADVDDFGSSANGESYGGDLIYNMSPNFYTGLGITRVKLGGYDTKFYKGTFGYRNFIDNNWAFRWEANLQQNETNLTEVMTTVGLQYFFGSTGQETKPTPAPQRAQPRPAPQPAAAPVDSDNDGVPNSRDACPNTPATYSVDEEGCVIYTNETLTETLLVEFEINSSQIRSGATSDIRDMADFMKEHPQLDIVIEGHTDYTGDDDYNQWLSERRAEAVANSLVNNFGIARSRVSSKGYGEQRPKVEGTSAEARQTNRRIEAKLSVTNRVPVIED